MNKNILKTILKICSIISIIAGSIVILILLYTFFSTIAELIIMRAKDDWLVLSVSIFTLIHFMIIAFNTPIVISGVNTFKLASGKDFYTASLAPTIFGLVIYLGAYIRFRVLFTLTGEGILVDIFSKIPLYNIIILIYIFTSIINLIGIIILKKSNK